MSSILLAFRIYKKRQPSELAKELLLSVQEYLLLEEGKMNLTDDFAEKLSSIYQVPIEIFLDEQDPRQPTIIYSHCNFTNCSNGYVSHLGENENTIEMMCTVKDQQILLLTEEVQRLREQNNKLIGDLINKVHV